MTKSLILIVPTRGRPESAHELAETVKATVVLPTTRVIYAVDSDDSRMNEYLTGIGDPWAIAINPRMRMGPTLNLVARGCANHSPDAVIGFMGDDHRPRTHGWDRRILDTFDGRAGVTYGNDLVHGEGLPTAAFVSAVLINKLGYMAPPGLLHMFLDNFWLELGAETRLTYLSDVVIEHMHPIVGKAEWDDGYIEVNGLMQRDATEFARFLTEDWPTDRLRIHGE